MSGFAPESLQAMQGLGCEAVGYPVAACQLLCSVRGQIGAPALVICQSEEVWLSAGNSRWLEHEVPGLGLPYGVAAGVDGKVS
jgi:hypothetical protein